MGQSGSFSPALAGFFRQNMVEYTDFEKGELMNEESNGLLSRGGIEMQGGSTENCIKIRGARQHNLKNIDLDIPRDKLVVITGLSGSGKSSLAFDTIYAEGQRRYVESLSSYARMFLGVMDKPDFDTITGLSPAISID